MAVALLAVVALAGMGLGFAADRVALRGQRREMRRFGAGGGGGPGFGGPDGRRGREGGGGRRADGMRDRLTHELDLTPEQARRVDSIMARQMADFRRIRSEMQPRFDSLLVQAQARLDSVLTPAQRERLKSLRAREAFGPRDSFGGGGERMRDFRPPPQFP
jgi:Spy/CpxP family protein refolding chaperone